MAHHFSGAPGRHSLPPRLQPLAGQPAKAAPSSIESNRMTIEAITWHLASELPDADTDVLISFGDDQGTLVGAWMGDEIGWVSTDGAPAEGVKHWAEMPKGPQC